MEWVKIGATLGTHVVSKMYQKTDEELNEVKRERDVYKKEAECLKSHLRDVQKYSRGHAHKPNNYNSQRNYNSKPLHTARKEITAGSQKQFAEKKSYGNSGNSRGFSQNNNSRYTQQSSAQQSSAQQSSSWFFGLWSASSPSKEKTNSSGFSNTGGSSGRGNYSHSRGRGGGRGNGRGRGYFRQ